MLSDGMMVRIRRFASFLLAGHPVYGHGCPQNSHQNCGRPPTTTKALREIDGAWYSGRMSITNARDSSERLKASAPSWSSWSSVLMDQTPLGGQRSFSSSVLLSHDFAWRMFVSSGSQSNHQMGWNLIPSITYGRKIPQGNADVR